MPGEGAMPVFDLNVKNPYVGPQFFLRSQDELFKGREKETAELADRLTARRLVLFYAESGAGKTSLINAGLIPLLYRRGFEILPVARVAGTVPKHVETANPYIYNVMAAIDQSKRPTERFADQQLSDFLLDLERREEDFVYVGQEEVLPEQEEDVYGDPLPEIPRRVLIIDQFEELFLTHAGAKPQEMRANFMRQITKAMEDDPYLYVLLSMRADYVHHLLRYVRLLPDDLRSRYYMSRLRLRQALRAVKEPARLLSQGFAEGVAEELVEYLARERTETEGGANGEWVTGDVVEPVQLQVVCYQLWLSLAPTAETIISRDDLLRVAQSMLNEKTRQTEDPLVVFVESALGSYYEYALAQVLAQTDTELTEEYLRDWFSHKLITDAGTRGFLPRGAENTAGVPEAVVAVLESLHIVRGENRAGGRWVELIHDSFIDPVRQANYEWTQRRATTWVSAAYRWESRGKPQYLLLSGDQLTEAMQEAGDLKHQPETVRSFLRACQKAEDDARVETLNRQIRRLIAVAVFGILALITGFTLAVFFYRQFLVANQNSLSLQAARLSEEGQELFESHNLEGAMLLALAAHERAQLSASLDETWLRRAEREIQALSENEPDADAAGIGDRSLSQVEDWLFHAMDEMAVARGGGNTFRLEGSVPSGVTEVISDTQLFAGSLPGDLIAAAPGRRWTWNPLEDSADVRPRLQEKTLLAVSDDGQIWAEAAGNSLFVSRQPFSEPSNVDLAVEPYEVYDAVFYPQAETLLVALCGLPDDSTASDMADPDVNLNFNVPAKGKTDDGRVWRFLGVAGDRVQIHVEGLGQGVEPRVELLDRDGNPLAEDDNSGGGPEALINAKLIGLGPYTIRVTSSSAGDYRIELALVNRAMNCQLQEVVASDNRDWRATAVPFTTPTASSETVWQSSTAIEGGIKALAFLNDRQLIWVDGGGSVSMIDVSSPKGAALPRPLEGIPDNHHTLSLLVIPEMNLLVTAGCIRRDGETLCQDDAKGFVQWWKLSESGPSSMGEPLYTAGAPDRQEQAPVVALASLRTDRPAQEGTQAEPTQHPPTKLVALDKKGRITVWEVNTEYWYEKYICELAGRNLTYEEWQRLRAQTGVPDRYEGSLTCDQKGYAFGVHVSFPIEHVKQACELNTALEILADVRPDEVDAFMVDAFRAVFDQVIGAEAGAEACLSDLPLLDQDLDPAQIREELEIIRTWELNESASEPDLDEVNEVFEVVNKWPSPVDEAALVYIGKAYQALCPLGEGPLDILQRACPRLKAFLKIARDLDEEPDTGPHNSNDVALWSFTAEPGEQISLTMEGLDPGVNPFLELFDEEGYLLASDDESAGAGNARLAYTIVRAGQYLVRATSLSQPGGRYQIGLDRRAPGKLRLGEGVTEHTGDQSVWTFEGDAGDAVTIVMEARSPDFTPLLRLYDPQGGAFGESNASGGTQEARIDTILEADGMYIVEATGFAGDGAYALAVSLNEAIEMAAKQIGAVAWKGDGSQLATGLEDGSIVIWDAETGSPVTSLTQHTGAIYDVAWNADSSLMASASSDQQVIVWDAGTWRSVEVFSGGNMDWVYALSWNPNDNRLAAGLANGSIIIWDMESRGRVAATIAAHDGPVKSVAWSRDGEQLASGSDDGTIRIWRGGNLEELAVLEGHQDWINSVAWNEDGSRLASASDDNTVILWDASTGERLATLRGHADWVRSVVWSPDGDQLASGSYDNNIIIWDAENGEPTSILRDHTETVFDVAWSRDGRLASASLDGTARIWDPASGGVLQTVSGAPR